MTIKGVTFDLWQTLLMDNPELGKARMKIRLNGAVQALGEAGEEYTEELVHDAYRRCYRSCQDIRAQERDVSFMEQVGIFIRHIDRGLEERLPDKVVQRIATVYADSFFCHPPPPHRDAASLLHGIKEKGYRVGLISNTGMTPGYTFRAYMEAMGILEYFDVLTFSDEVRLAKPSREIFFQTVQALGLQQRQVVHVGDHLLNDVFGAKRADMRTIWIEHDGESRPELDVQPDITVPSRSLGEVYSAIESLALE